MSDDYRNYRESVELYPVGSVSPIVPISKNKRKAPEKAAPKEKDGLFSALLDDEQKPAKQTDDGFSAFTKERIAQEENQRRAFQKKVQDLANQISGKLKEHSEPE